MNFIMTFSYVHTLCFAHMDLLMLFSLSLLYTFRGSLPLPSHTPAFMSYG